MPETKYIVVDRPLMRPAEGGAVELHGEKYPGECVTLGKARLRATTPEEMLREIREERWLSSCPAKWCPSEKTLEVLLEGLQEARVLALA